MLTAARLRELLHYDPKTGIFTRLISPTNSVKVGDIAGSPDGKGHLRIRVDGRRYQSHRLAWLYETGEWPVGEIDHENLHKPDNRFANLREATRSQNNANRPVQKNNTTGFKGVSWHKRDRRWQAQIKVNRKRIHLGYFGNFADAVAVRTAAHREHFREFARTTRIVATDIARAILFPSQRTAPARPVTLSYYIGKGELTAGYYASADDAKEACPEVVRWIEYEPGHWRSQDGFTLIEPA